MSISVVILTLNEEQNLSGALASLRGLCDDVVVFDSYSADATCSIAQESGARVVQRRFENYGAQRQAAMLEVSYKHPWLLMIDADERMDPALWIEMVRRVEDAPADTGLFRFRRKDHFMGKWIRHSSGYPTWFGRLMKLGHARVERSINEEYVTEGRIEHLDGHLLHFPFGRGLAHWIDRHNRYSTMEAAIVVRKADEVWRLRDLLSPDPICRRKALKNLGYKMPLRPMLVFLYLYILRAGFLDGYPGFCFCVLRGMYELLIDLKKIEIQRGTL
jgi:glycosyltransferase involved in cell wall biosynthesis